MRHRGNAAGGAPTGVERLERGRPDRRIVVCRKQPVALDVGPPRKRGHGARVLGPCAVVIEQILPDGSRIADRAGRFEHGKGRHRAVRRLVGDRQIVADERYVGREGSRALEAGYRTGDVAGIQFRKAPVAQEQRIVGRKPERAAERGQRFARTAECAQRVAFVVVGIGEGRLQISRAREGGKCFVISSGGQCYLPRQVDGVDVPRIARQQLAIDRVGLSQPACPMVFECRFERDRHGPLSTPSRRAGSRPRSRKSGRCPGARRRTARTDSRLPYSPCSANDAPDRGARSPSRSAR